MIPVFDREETGIIGLSCFHHRAGEDEMSAVKVTVKPKSARKQAVEIDLGFNWGVLNTILLGAGLAVLAAGYWVLSQGSITLAPVLLVLGYCGLIPASLLVGGRNEGSGE